MDDEVDDVIDVDAVMLWMMNNDDHVTGVNVGDHDKDDKDVTEEINFEDAVR